MNKIPTSVEWAKATPAERVAWFDTLRPDKLASLYAGLKVPSAGAPRISVEEFTKLPSLAAKVLQRKLHPWEIERLNKQRSNSKRRRRRGKGRGSRSQRSRRSRSLSAPSFDFLSEVTPKQWVISLGILAISLFLWRNWVGIYVWFKHANFFTLFLLLALLPLYMLPAMLAKKVKSTKYREVFLMNLLFGWTFIGWIGALYLGLVTTSFQVPGLKKSEGKAPKRKKLKAAQGKASVPKLTTSEEGEDKKTSSQTSPPLIPKKVTLGSDPGRFLKKPRQRGNKK